MSEMIERVARATCEAGNVMGFKCVCPHPVDGWCESGRMQFKARAAIRAMRDPTPSMILAGYAAWDKFGAAPTMGPEELIAVWRAMCDAAG